MKLHKTVAAALLILSCASFTLAEADARKTFDMLKGMEGNWAGKNQQGQPLEVTFRVTAAGSALLTEIHSKGKDDMITMIHLDGDRLLMTHYCSAGNQPRMKATSSDARSVQFEFVDGTNIGAEDGHMQNVTFTQTDADHHTENWIFVNHGNKITELFTLERVK